MEDLWTYRPLCQLAQKATGSLHLSDSDGWSAKQTHGGARAFTFSQLDTFLPIIYVIHAGMFSYKLLCVAQTKSTRGFHLKEWMDGWMDEWTPLGFHLTCFPSPFFKHLIIIIIIFSENVIGRLHFRAVVVQSTWINYDACLWDGLGGTASVCAHKWSLCSSERTDYHSEHSTSGQKWSRVGGWQ